MSVDTPVSPVTLPVVESQEQQMMREAVRGIASSFGRDYMLEKINKGEPATELCVLLSSKG